MNPARTGSPDQLEEQLVAYHEALLAGETPPDSGELPSGTEHCLNLLERARRQQGDRGSGSQGVFGPASEPSQPGRAKSPSAADDSAPAGHLVPTMPARIGRFQIQRRLGEGGFGIVFLALDPLLNRRVALKLPRPEAVVSASWRSRFLREAEAAALLDHPRIVPVYEVGQAGSLCYIVQAWCDGISLDRWIRDHGPCRSPQAAASLVATLAETVQHAHSRGVLHRDIKPSNVLLEIRDREGTERRVEGETDEDREGKGQSGSEGEVAKRASTIRPLSPAPTLPLTALHHSRLTTHDSALPSDSVAEDQLASVARLADFGLARLIERGSQQTNSGAVLGTPSYMAPEQAEGRIADVAATADVYSLGAMLFELLTGRPPFDEATLLATLQAVREREPPRLSSLCDGVPPDLEAICHRCLEKSPPRRYATAADLAADLRRFLRGEVVVARRVSEVERFIRWCRRHRLLAALAATILLLVVALATGSTAAAIWLAQAQRETLDSLEAEIVAKDKATKSEELALRAVFEARVAEARASRRSGLPRRRTEALAALQKAAAHIQRLKLDEEALRELRNEAIAAMALVELRLDRQWPDQPPRYPYASTGFDAQVDRYAALESDGKIAIRRLADNAEQLRLPGLGRLDQRPFLLFSPDGRYLAVRGADDARKLRVQLWNLNQPDAPIVDEAAGGRVTDRSLDFSPDSSRLIFASTDGKIQIFGIAAGKYARPLALGWSPYFLRFSPQGDRLAMTNDHGDEVLQLSPATLRPRGPELKHATTVIDAAFSPSGQLLATACRDWKAHVWDAEAGSHLTSCQHHQGLVHHVAFNETGELLMSSGWGSTALWEPLSGRQLVQSSERGVRFSRDGRFLASAVPGVVSARWEVAAPQEHFTLSGHLRDSFVYQVAFHPGGRLLASAGGNDAVRLWDLFRRKEVAQLRSAGNSVAFTRDGKTLLVGGQGKDVFRIPLTITHQTDAVQVHLGEPQRIYSKIPNFANVSFSADGRALATTLDLATAVVVARVDEPGQRVEIRGAGLRFHDFSPDGTLIAVGNWDGANCGVYDSRSGKLVKQLSDSGSARVCFSPDGRFLACSRYDECTLWDVQSWTPRYRVRHGGSSYGVAAFSSDGRLAGVTTPDAVKLIDMADGHEVAALYCPTTLEAKSIGFSPDGCYLAVGTRRHAIRVWNLGLVRAKLRELGVDWNQPALKVAPESPPHLEVQIDRRLPAVLEPPEYQVSSRADIERLTGLLAKQPQDVKALWQRARAYVALGQHDEAITDCDRALAIDRENQHAYYWRARASLNAHRCAEALADFRESHARHAVDDWCLRHMAWILVAGPPELRNTQEARRLAEEAVKVATERKRSTLGTFVATLGMAHYRLGEHEVALARLDEAVELGAADSRTLLFLALCHAQLGSGESARLCFEEASRLIREQRLDDGLGNVELLLAETQQVPEIAVTAGSDEQTP